MKNREDEEYRPILFTSTPSIPTPPDPDSSLLTKQGTRGYNHEMKSTRGTRGEALDPT
ncbi:hypothetical protein M404DRAFT_711617 [Pisolithus tinctorius Marx 270]|uniref:Uncharacterized protein n=1 Tax=Pisolithus tinctorius Marx 270 TaxID=870435 RepID=A0A0C3JXC8_PISTI|nr:hypothetical protein M404DRAFT_711617 [Pisolithus tinctorius Marx 270]